MNYMHKRTDWSQAVRQQQWQIAALRYCTQVTLSLVQEPAKRQIQCIHCTTEMRKCFKNFEMASGQAIRDQ